MSNMWKVEIIENGTGKVERSFEYPSQRLAERAEDGVQRNLDHTRFSTRIVPPAVTPLFSLWFDVDRDGRVRRRRCSRRGIHVRFIRRGTYRISSEELRLVRNPSVHVRVDSGHNKSVTKRKDGFDVHIWVPARITPATPWSGTGNRVHVQLFDLPEGATVMVG